MAQVPNMSQVYEKLTVQPPQNLSDPLDVQAPNIPFVKQEKPFSLQLTIGQDHLTEEKPGIYFEMNAGLMAGSQKVKSESENLLNLSGLFSDDWSILISLPTIKDANQVANELRQLKENVPQEEQSIIGLILTQLLFDFDFHVRDNNVVIKVVNKHPQFEGISEMSKQMSEPFADVIQQEVFINNKFSLAKGINEIVQENALPIMQIFSGLSFQTCISLPQNWLNTLSEKLQLFIPQFPEVAGKAMQLFSSVGARVYFNSAIQIPFVFINYFQDKWRQTNIKSLPIILEQELNLQEYDKKAVKLLKESFSSEVNIVVNTPYACIRFKIYVPNFLNYAFGN